jgi:hypothetical protein
MALAPLALLWMVACLIGATFTGLCRLLFVCIGWLETGAEGEQATMREIWADDWEESITKSLLNSAFCPFSI